MTIAKWVPVLVVFVALNAYTTDVDADVTGHWKVVYSGPGDGPKTVGSIVLELHSTGTAVVGQARIGVWPGDAPVADGKIVGDHLTFTATGHLGSTTAFQPARLTRLSEAMK